MSGYTVVFDSVYHGTLCGRWPTLPVWLTILPMADKHGHIDLTYQAISALTIICDADHMDILRKYGCMRLAARIRDLRQGGFRVLTVNVSRNGKHYARYVMG